MRSTGGTLLLRVEDIDGPRVKAGAEQALIEDLTWLGLDWDGEPIRQSERLDWYRDAVDRLVSRGLAYPCVCSRKEIEAAASAPHEPWQDATAYPGTCRGRYATLAEAKARSGRDPAIRFRVEPAQDVPFDDAFRGPEKGLICGDFVIQKRDSGPAYQLAVVVDDAATGVDLIVRGDDLLASTPRQLLLYRALGLREPTFAHLPLLVGEDGLRLAKRHGDTSLRAFRDQGVAPERLVGYLASRSGLAEAGATLSAGELLAEFALGRVPRTPVIVPDGLGIV